MLLKFSHGRGIIGVVNIQILLIKFDIGKQISLVNDMWGTKIIDKIVIKTNMVITSLKITEMLFNRIISQSVLSSYSDRNSQRSVLLGPTSAPFIGGFHFNNQRINITFTHEVEQDNKRLFLDILSTRTNFTLILTASFPWSIRRA